MKVFITIVISSILIILPGCDKNKENKYFQGNIVGFVKLTNEIGNEIDDKSGVNVSIDGLANTMTNNNGRFEFKNVPAGTYKLIYDKPGYGSHKRFSYQFIGGNVPALLDETTLYELPNIEIQSLDISFKDDRINISGIISDTRAYRFHVFFNNSSDVSNLNYDYSFFTSRSSGTITQFSNSIDVFDTPYTKGDKIYLVIYFYNYHDTGYFDFETEKHIYPSHKKASDVVSLILVSAGQN